MENLKQKYLDEHGSTCPYCDSNDLETVTLIQWSAPDYAQETEKCGNCNRKWVITYKICDVTFL